MRELPAAHEPPEVLRGVASLALVALLLAVPFGTTALEAANGVALAAALAVVIARRALPTDALFGPTVVLAAGWAMMSLGPGGTATAALDRAWALSTLIAVPALLAVARPLPFAAIGLAGALLVLAPTAAQAALALGGGPPPTGPWSHHLTLAYALVPPFGAAVGARAWRVAAAIALASVLSGSAGAWAALAACAAVTLLAERHRAAAIGLGGGAVAATLAGFASPLARGALHDRAVLWTAGARIAGAGGTAPGTWREVVPAEHRALAPTFAFPQHAHDTAIQAVATAGPAAWIALGWALFEIARRAPPGLLGATAGLCVAGLTQDWLGDLEVLRVASMWAAIGLHASATERA